MSEFQMLRRPMKATALLLMIGLIGLIGPRPVQAQTYPTKPVKIINPYSPGGSTDAVLRPLTERLLALTGQAFVIDYKPGAGTNIGSELAARSAPDGYTVLLGTSSLTISPSLYNNLRYNAAKDLLPVALLVNTPFTMAVNGDLPVRDIRQLIEHARRNPGKLNYGSSGTGGAIHLGMELFKNMTGTQMVHVPFKGSGESVTSLMNGTIQVLLSPSTNLAAHVGSGRLRMLAVANAERVPGLDLPTVSEAGVPGFEAGVWMGFFVPAGTPETIVRQLNQQVRAALEDPGLRSAYARQGMVTGGGGVEVMDKLFRDELKRWPEVVRASAISLQ
jgi:tripartite-type tricarboxylate transporter receptor subunit TctC